MLVEYKFLAFALSFDDYCILRLSVIIILLFCCVSFSVAPINRYIIGICRFIEFETRSKSVIITFKNADVVIN